MQGSHDITRENHLAAKAFDGKTQFSVKAVAPLAGRRGGPSIIAGWWAFIPIMLGLLLVALCVWIPAIADLDQLRLDQSQLDREVAHARKQSDVNREFVTAVQSDDSLRQRLAALRDQSLADRVAQTLGSPIDGEEKLEAIRIQTPLPPMSALSLPRVAMDQSPLENSSSVPLILRPLTYSTPRVIVLGLGMLLVAWGLLFGAHRRV